MARSTLNFTGAGVAVSDDAGNDRINVAITGGGSTGGEYINLARDYGASSGSDITTALQNVATDINAGSQPSYTVYLPGTGYTWSALINFTKPVKLVGDGFGSTTLRRTSANGQLKFTGVRGTSKTFTADAAANQSVVTVNTTGLSAGQYAIIRTDTAEISSTAGASVGEIVRIKTVGATTVTLYAPLIYTHSILTPLGASNTPQFTPLTLLGGCSVEGMRVYQSYGALTASNDVFKGLIRFQYCEGPSISELLLTGYDQVGAGFDTCVDALATKIRCRDSYWSNAGWWSYGIENRGPTRNSLFSQCFSRNAGFIAGGGNADGAPLRIRIADCGGTENVEDQSAAGVYKSMFELHGDCHEWSLANCYAENGNGIGFEIKGRNAILDNPKAHDMNEGIHCFGGDALGTRILMPDVKNTNSYGIVLAGNCTVQGGRLENTGNVAGILSSTLSSPYGAGACVVTGTEFRTSGGTSATAGNGQGAVVFGNTTDIAKDLVVRGASTQIGVNYKSGGVVPTGILMVSGGAATGTH